MFYPFTGNMETGITNREGGCPSWQKCNKNRIANVNKEPEKEFHEN